jgi:hypothetical protein
MLIFFSFTFFLYFFLKKNRLEFWIKFLSKLQIFQDSNSIFRSTSMEWSE